MKTILMFEKPNGCNECKLHYNDVDDSGWFHRGCCATGKAYDDGSKVQEWCPLSHPLKSIGNDFYIYDRQYLFDNLDREIDLLIKTKRFIEYMRERKMKGTWRGTITLKFDGVKARDRDELMEKLEDMFDHDFMEFDDMDEEYIPTEKEVMEW